jgi:UDP-glucose 4-epimerase
VSQVDWRDARQVDRALTGADALVMLAAANEIDAASNPVPAAEATATQCLAWLESAKRCGLQRVVYFSTIHVYGRIDGECVNEERPTRPAHPYASTHLAAEVYVQTAHRIGPMASTIFRLSNAFGAPVDPNVNRWSLLVNDLARQAVRVGELRLTSDGTQTRDFIGMGQVCAAVSWALTQPRASNEAAIYNLASGASMTVYEMACRVAERTGLLLGRTPEISRPSPDSSQCPPPHGRFDVSRLAKSGFVAKTDTNREIDDLLRFCLDHNRSLSGS